MQDVQLEYTSNDSFGAVRGGRLLLRGVLQQVQLLREPLDFDLLNKAETAEVQETFFGTSEGAYSVVLNGKRAGERANLDRNPYKRYEEENCGGTLFCMLIGKWATSSVAVPYGFLVLQVVNAAEGTFKRLGVFSLPRGEEEDALAFSRHEDEALFPCLEYMDGKHSIWII